MAQKIAVVNTAAEKKASTKEAAARRLEREQRRAALRAKGRCEQVEEPSIEVDSVHPEPVPSQKKSTPTTSLAASSVPYSVKIPTSSEELAWYSPTEHTCTTLDAAREAGIWSYPETSAQKARCGVFRALWEKGYYMGCGIKFGGDFLVYPGELQRSLLSFICNGSYPFARDQVIHCDTIHTSSLPCLKATRPRSDQWRSSLTDALVLRRRKLIYCAHGMRILAGPTSFR